MNGLTIGFGGHGRAGACVNGLTIGRCGWHGCAGPWVNGLTIGRCGVGTGIGSG
ncbi:hypothetical protein ACTID9_07755 [Brevibacillus fluminis]|uniref:hypothetical protein n=1 Tax=Brevibacillus fluminis TaxID=511487 RepID=UPI003F8B9175